MRGSVAFARALCGPRRRRNGARLATRRNNFACQVPALGFYCSRSHGNAMQNFPQGSPQCVAAPAGFSLPRCFGNGNELDWQRTVPLLIRYCSGSAAKQFRRGFQRHAPGLMFFEFMAARLCWPIAPLGVRDSVQKRMERSAREHNGSPNRRANPT